MADEFDGCECVWSHELAMQRLLNFIRQNQNHCTDTECIDVSGRLQQRSASSLDDSSSNDNFMILTICLILAVLMMFIRPDTILNLTGTKPRRDRNQRDQDGSGNSPRPPPAPPAIH